MTEGRAIETTVCEFIVDSRKLDSLDWERNIFEERLVSSMFAMQLISFIESRFGITVEDEDLDMANFASVNLVAAFVRRKSGQRLPPSS